MTPLETAVFATIALSVLSWAAAEALQSRVAWSVGALLALIHAVLAFAVFYGWSHEIARDATTRQTERLTGVVFAGGIYVNYLFLLVWLGDAAWSWLSPRSHAARPRALDLGVHAFIFFIMVNGAVVFADGLARALGAVATSVVGLAWLRRMSR